MHIARNEGRLPGVAHSWCMRSRVAADLAARPGFGTASEDAAD